MYIKTSSLYKDICAYKKRFNDILRKEKQMPDSVKPAHRLGWEHLKLKKSRGSMFTQDPEI